MNKTMFKLHVKHWSAKQERTKPPQKKINKKIITTKKQQQKQKKPKKQPNRHKKEGFVGQRNSTKSRNYMYIDKLDLGRYITTLIKVHIVYRIDSIFCGGQLHMYLIYY